MLAQKIEKKLRCWGKVMKTYVILCETMHRAEWLWRYTRLCLGEVVDRIHKVPMLNIETRDGVLLYFTSYYMWYTYQSKGRHDLDIIQDWKFQEMLDIWAAQNMDLRKWKGVSSSTEVTRNNG